MITYGSTTLTSYNTITKIEVYYYKSTSATSLSGGSWSTTKPTWENGKYIWQKIRTTYEGKLENGQYYSESDPVNITGQQGATGTAAYSYKLNASDTSITVSKNGTYSKTSVTFSATSKQGTGTVNAYAGWFKIETTANGTTWTTQYTSSANESSKEYTIPTGILNIRCSLYQAGGTSVLLDIVSVAIVKDGIDGASQNLLLDVYATSLTKVKAPWSRYISDISNSTITGEFIEEANLPDPNATHFLRFTDSSATTYGRGLCFYSNGTPPFINGHTYKIGCWVRKHAGEPKICVILGSMSGGFQKKTITNTDWEWIEWVRTFGETDSTIDTHRDSYKRLYFYFYNNNVKGSSLDICGFRLENVQTDISTARNLLFKTEKLIDWETTNGVTISDGIATIPEVTANTVRGIYSTKNFDYELIRNQTAIFSVRVKAEADKICGCNLCIGLVSAEDSTTIQKYYNNYVHFTGTGNWQTICIATPIFDDYFASGTGTIDYDNCWVAVKIESLGTYHNGFQVKEPQFSLGTTATAWSPAPEDVNENIQQVQDNLDNLEIGGRNLLLNTATERISPASSNDSAYVVPSPRMSDYASGILNNRDDYFTYSFDYEVTGNEASAAFIYVQIKGSTVPPASKGYYSYVLEKPTGKHCCTFQLTSAQATGTYLYCGIRLRNATNGAILRVWNIKLERGTRATDWTPAPEDVENSIKTYAESIQTQVDGMAEIHYGTAVPTLSNAPASSWTDTATKDLHVDDLYYNTSTGYCYRFTKSGSTYSWSRIKDSDITAAATAASNANTAAGNAQTTANNANTLAGQKRRIFVAQPTPPYEVGDLWVEGSNGDIKKCKTARASGSYTANDWELASKYTDDTLANEANDKIDNLEIGGRNILLNSATNFPVKYKSSTLTTQSNVAIPEFKCTDGLRCYGKTGTGNSICLLINTTSHGLSVSSSTSVQDQQYVLSMYIKNNHETNSFFVNSNIPSTSGTQTIQPGEAKRVVFYATGNDYHEIQINLKTNAAEDDYDITFWHPQIELGNKVTDWKPAPEDTDASIQQVQDNLDNLEIGGRNLLPFKDCPSKTLTRGGITLTKEEDGWIRVSGTRSGTSLTTFTLWQNPDGDTYTAPINSYVPQNGNTNQFTLSVETEGTPFIMGDTYINSTHIVAYGSTGGTSWRIGGINGTSITDVFPTYMSVIKYYVGANSTGTVNGRFRVKLERGNKATNWTPAPEDTQADIDTVLAQANTALEQSVEYIVGTQTAATGTWTGATTDNELKIGKTIAYKLPYAGSENASLVLTLADGSTTDAVPVYLNTTRVTTHFGANSVINMTYDGQYWRASSIPNSNTVGVYGGAFTAGTNGVRGYSLVMRDTQNTWVSITTSAGSNSTNAGNGTNHAKYTGGLYFDTVMYEGSNANYASGASIGTCYTALAVDLRYSTNCGSTLIKGRDVYLVGTIINDLFYLDNTWWTQTLPTSQNDKVYIYLGSAYSTTSIYLVENNPAYMYYEGKFLTLEEIETEKAKKTATNYMSSDNTGIMVADLADGEQLPANATGKNVFITAGYGSGDVAVDAGVHIRDGQTDLAIFGESTRIGKENDSNVSIDNNGIIINKGSKELAKYSSKGIAFDEEIPYKIGNDNSYIAFEDTDNDNRADSLSIVADSIYFRDAANTNIKDTLNGLQSDLAIAQEDIDLKNNYIKINTSEPSIVISASSNTNDTNLKLESSQLSFQIDGQTTATITNDQMNIPTASVTNLFMQSINASTNTVYEKVWVMRTNGHLSLKTITRN